MGKEWPAAGRRRFEGELDASSAAEVREAFAFAPPGTSVVIDLTDVTFIDSAGLGAVIGGIRRIRDTGGVVVICGARPHVAQLLHATGVDRLAVLDPSPEPVG